MRRRVGRASAPRHPCRSAAHVAALFALLAAGAPARANGRFPRAQYAVVQPGAAPRTIAVRATFGLLVSDDGGATFRYICEDPFQYVDGYDPSLLVATGGALMVGVQDGLVLMSRDRCDVSRAPALDNQQVVDLASDPSGSFVYAALASQDAVSVARVAVSDDGGATFTVPAAGIAGVTLATVEVAPSNAARLYASATEAGSGRDVFYRSDDAGRSLVETGALVPGTSGWYVAGVDARDADVVYVRANLAGGAGSDDGGAGGAGTVLLRSDDGGARFTEVARTAGPMRGFAIADDGATVWVGGPDARDGLLRSEHGGAFERVNDAPVECLRYAAGALYVCETYMAHGVALGRSMDQGTTIEPLVRFDTIASPPSCPAGTVTADVCPARWAQVHAQLDPAVTAMDASSDAGRIPPPPGGCGCTVGSSRGEDRGALIALLALVLAARYARSRSRTT